MQTDGGPDGDSEGNPVAVMEAQLSGLPVVATRHAGIPEVVLEGQTGLLVKEGDEAGMAQAMARLLMDPDLAARLGDCGRRRIQERFTIEHHLRQGEQLLCQVIGDRQAHRRERSMTGASRARRRLLLIRASATAAPRFLIGLRSTSSARGPGRSRPDFGTACAETSTETRSAAPWTAL